MTAGRPRLFFRRPQGQQKQSGHRPYPWYPPFIGQIDVLTLDPRVELLLCAKHLFVAAMMAGVHPGLPRISKSGHDGRAVRLEQGQQKQSATVPTLVPAVHWANRRLTLAPRAELLLCAKHLFVAANPKAAGLDKLGSPWRSQSIGWQALIAASSGSRIKICALLR